GQVIPHAGPANSADVHPSIHFSFKGDQLALGTQAPTPVAILDTSSGKKIREFPKTTGTYGVAWRSDGKVLALGNGNHISIWDLETGKEKARLEGHKSTVIWIAFNPQGNLLASLGWDSTLRLWDAQTYQQLASVPCNGSPIFSHDGRHMAYQNKDVVGTLEI